MKKSELRQIIKEETQNIINEDLDLSWLAATPIIAMIITMIISGSIEGYKDNKEIINKAKKLGVTKKQLLKLEKISKLMAHKKDIANAVKSKNYKVAAKKIKKTLSDDELYDIGAHF